MAVTTEDLRVLLHGDSDCAVIDLHGELGDTSVAFLRDVVEQLIAEPAGAARIEIHVGALERCDAVGTELIVTLERSAARAGRILVLVGAWARV